MNKRQINLLFPALIGIGAIGAITGISLGIVELVKRQENNKNNDSGLYEWLPTQEIYGVPIKENVVQGKTSFFGTDTDNNGVSEGFEMLKNFVDTRLHDGPEWSALKSINFGPGRNGWFIDDTAYGVYYPETRELFINTKPLTDDFPISSNNPNLYLEERMEIMFQTLFHEYGHHVANLHIVKNEHDKVATSNSIYSSNSSSRYVEPWSKTFVSDFKSALNYDKATPHYQTADIKVKSGNSYSIWTNRDGYRAKSIGSVYDAQALFNKANSSSIPSYREAASSNTPNNKYYYAFNPVEASWGPLLLDSQEDINNLEYYYSMQELFTRKTMQLMYKYYDTGRLNGDASFSPPGSAGTYASSLIYDKLRYEDELLDSNGETIKKTSMRYLHDGVFDQGYYLGTADTGSENKLFNSFLKTTGAYALDNISTVWQNNPAEAIASARGVSITSIPNSQVAQLMRSIKFGGFYSSGKNYSHIGYYDNDNNFVGLPIISRPYSIGRKNKVISGDWTKETEKVAMQYSLKDFVDVSTIDDKELYFANQVIVNEQVSYTDIDKMTSAKDDVNGYGDTSTKLYYNPREFTGKGADSYFKAHKTTEGGVVISNLTSVNFFADEVEEGIWARTKIVKL